MNRRDPDRRAIFFFSSAAVCALLVFAALPKYRYVGEVLAAAQATLGVLSAIDHRSRRRRNSVPSRD